MVSIDSSNYWMQINIYKSVKIHIGRKLMDAAIIQARSLALWESLVHLV